ncbi:MAG: xanthine dehydrogenase small subunit, partial [Deltaproteobacteria bacterium]|nr:xanthine dehydrogenase small subunit [Deltaproteobacteria bacterium]
RAQSISKVCACFRKSSSCKIAYGSVAPTPSRCYDTEKFLNGRNIDSGTVDEAVRMVRQEVSPMDDIRSTANYRRHVAGVLLKRFLESV